MVGLETDGFVVIFERALHVAFRMVRTTPVVESIGNVGF
jgi:hypothetical protein